MGLRVAAPCPHHGDHTALGVMGLLDEGSRAKKAPGRAPGKGALWGL